MSDERLRERRGEEKGKEGEEERKMGIEWRWKRTKDLGLEQLAFSGVFRFWTFSTGYIKHLVC